MGVLSNGLIGIGSSLKYLSLSDNSIGNEGLSTLVDALQTCTGLETLHLSGNDFSSAAAGLGSLSTLLQRYEVNLKHLELSSCRINDEGLRALSQGAANHCEEIDLFPNESITSTGLSYLSSSIRSDSCRVKTLYLQGMQIGDDGMEVLGQGLVGNQSLIRLHLVHLDEGLRLLQQGGWPSPQHYATWGETIQPQQISRYLQLNGRHPRYAARCKILMSHKHLDMAPLLHWGLKFLPLAVAWFERAKPCTALTIYDEDPDLRSPDLRRRVLDESDEAFESRALSAVYEFVRGMPMEVMKSRNELALAAAYDEKIARIEEESKLALEQRDRKNLQLEEEIARLKGENERLSGIVEVVRKSLGD
ncbi:leucine-rich repeat protein [Skeletonema marinoi]|uniref:Leucine-rich repeat protein n=1 Tax=Skeletonema marinoi TaxID=267567 RepID=A0AAD8YDH7_9STRA|nr:leucine-rich repeat protein [Skeletonema marinoi]